MTWEEKDGCLFREFEFKDFSEAFDFIKKVSQIAQALNHHPEWYNNYNKVWIKLTTHDAGRKVTELDLLFSKKINEILRR